MPLPHFKREGGGWHRLATGVMQPPLLVLLPTLGILAVVARPFTRLETASTDIRALAPTRSSRARAR